MTTGWNLATLVTFDALVEIKAEPILYFAPRIQDRHRPDLGVEIIMFDLFYVICNLPAGVCLAENASRIMQQKEDSKGYRDYRGPDRKSTRLNSSHTVISYAVF